MHKEHKHSSMVNPRMNVEWYIVSKCKKIKLIVVDIFFNIKKKKDAKPSNIYHHKKTTQGK